MYEHFGTTLRASREQIERAHAAARGRQRGKEFRRPEGDLGSPEANYRAEYFGALAEIVLIDALIREGLRPGNWKLVERYHVPAADFKLNGVRYEIKSSPPGQHFLTINERQHRECRADFYIAVCFVDPETVRVSAPIPHIAINGWVLREKHSPYRSLHRRALPRLDSLANIQKRPYPPTDFRS